MTMSDEALERLRESHPVLAEVIDSDREIAAQRSLGIVDLGAILIRHERVRAAEAQFGYQLRGSGDRPA